MRRYRFSLRSAVLLMGAASLLFGWAGRQVASQAAEQRQLNAMGDVDYVDDRLVTF